MCGRQQSEIVWHILIRRANRFRDVVSRRVEHFSLTIHGESLIRLCRCFCLLIKVGIFVCHNLSFLVYQLHFKFHNLFEVRNKNTINSVMNITVFYGLFGFGSCDALYEYYSLFDLTTGFPSLFNNGVTPPAYPSQLNK